VALRSIGAERSASKISTQVALQRFSHAYCKNSRFRQCPILDSSHVTRGKNPGMAECLERGCDSNEAFARSVQSAFFQPCGRRSLCGPKNQVSGEGFSAVESYTILHHLNYPATFDYRYPARA